MPSLTANGIEIEYEEFGSRAAPPLLLIMGLGAQMILWDEEFCEALAARGLRVIRFDNRDVGLSAKFGHAGAPNVMAALEASARGERIEAPYTLDDMADDAAGVLDGLGIETAHVVGASMGGMIAQVLAIQHPDRVRTLTSLMSTTGHPDLPAPTPDAMRILLSPAPTDRAANIERALETFRVIGSPGFPFEEERLRELAARAYDRCFHPAGFARQLVAILASGSRREALASIRVPTLVLHGDADPLVSVEGGIDTAKSVPGATLRIIPGLGHDLARGAWPEMIDAIAEHAAQAAA